jgi:predicted  nucleic acid-binding Zn-ribbon protein
MNAPFDRKTATPRTDYRGDLHAWAREQAALLRAGRIAEADAANIAEELDDVGDEQYDKLESALRVLLTHILKWDHQPERRGRSWEATIRTQRKHVAKVLRKNPSLKASLDEATAEAWNTARSDASGETNLPIGSFPEAIPYDWAAIMDRPFEVDPPG